MAGLLELHEDTIAEIAARLNLRDPNREAVQTLAAEVSQCYNVDEQQPRSRRSSTRRQVWARHTSSLGRWICSLLRTASATS